MITDINAITPEYMKYRIEQETEQYKQEIERLNNIINEYKSANEYHQKIIHELETMKQPNQLHSENVKLRAENKKLNNIINELEKRLEVAIEDNKKEYSLKS